MTDDATLQQWARLAASGDRVAAEQLLTAIQDGLYQLAVRMLGHPADAEDATQEVLLVILTHLGSFRAESAFRTWSWRIASNHLLRAKKGRLERVTFESIAELLQSGIGADEPELPDLERQVFAREVRLRCTEAMLLSLDRSLRIAFVLGDIFELSGDEAAAVLEIDAMAFRKRLSRARTRLLAFLKAQCGVYDPSNPCRCARQVAPAIRRGQLGREELLFVNHPARAPGIDLDRCAEEVEDLIRAAEVIRHPSYSAPASVLGRIRTLLTSGELELLRVEGQAP